ncbi:hypothetical protein V2J09_000515 [Rumex salicifolius]
MKKLLDFGRKAMFYVRVLSGYEERRIRSLRLQLEQRVQSAQQRKLAVNKIPEQIILAEVRRMVEEMKNLNKSLEETETSINEYFMPLDKEAEALIDMQCENEKAKAEMMATMYKQALYERAEAEAAVEVNKAKMIQHKLEQEPNAEEPQKAQMR